MGKLIVLSDEIKDDILELASTGKTLNEIRKKHNLSQAAWRNLLKDTSFANSVASARAEGLEELADQLITIPEEIQDVNKARLKSDNLKWILAKRAPRTYGDRIELNVNQTIDIASALNDAKNRVLRSVVQLPIVAKNATSSDNSTMLNDITDLESVEQPSPITDDDIFS